jgi:hypothetical protein
MALALYSVIRRHMKRTGRYFEPGGSVDTPDVPGWPRGESVLGWYRNPEPWHDCLVVFTDVAVYSVGSGDVMRLPWSDIVDYETPPSKIDVDGVWVRTAAGRRFLRASGSFGPHGNQKDAFSLIAVLGVVISRR